MSRRLAELAWPPLPGSTEPPVWQGEHFLVGGRPMRVLPYEAAPSHWSPELTELHEAEAGSTHPIDEASRSLAAQSLVCFTPRPNACPGCRCFNSICANVRCPTAASTFSPR